MDKILLRTRSWLEEELRLEFSSLRKVSSGVFVLDVENLSEFLYKILFYSRFVEGVYILVSEFESLDLFSFFDIDFGSRELSFEVETLRGFIFDSREAEKIFGEKIRLKWENLSVDLSEPDISFHLFSSENKSFLGLDIIGFPLSRRNHKIYTSPYSLSAMLCLKLFSIMGLKFGKEISVLDPFAHLGDLIIEASYFSRAYPIFSRKRDELSIQKFRELSIPVPNSSDMKGKFVALANDNRQFKYLREHIQKSSQEIKVSQFDLDFLDVKFVSGQFDYVLSSFPFYRDEEEFSKMLEYFFYQCAFVSSKGIGIISRQEISSHFAEKNKLTLSSSEIIRIGEQNFYLYFFKKGRAKKS